MRLFSAQAFQERIAALGDMKPRDILVFDEIDSTSTELKRRLMRGAEPWTVAVAHRQTGGRGRMGRVWHSPSKGNLCLSILIETGAPTYETVPLLPLAAGLAAHEAVTEAGADARIKWPNDISASGRKLAGILCEAASLSKDRALIIVGIGVNIVDAPFPPEIADTATSLNALLGKEADMSKLAARFATSLESWNSRISSGQRASLIDEWRKRAEPFGRRVRVGDVTGRTVDLAEDGRLIVLDDEGKERLIAGGIVEFLEAPPSF